MLKKCSFNPKEIFVGTPAMGLLTCAVIEDNRHQNVINYLRCFASFLCYYHISLEWENNALCFRLVFPQDDECIFKKKKWNYAPCSPFADCQSLAAAILGGNMRSDSEAAGKRWEWGNFLTTNVRPWAWVLQWSVRAGTGVFLIMHFTKPAFKYPGSSWSRCPPAPTPQRGFKFRFNHAA